MSFPFVPEYRGGRGHPPAHPPEDRHVPRRHLPAALSLRADPHALPDSGTDRPRPAVPPTPRATLIELAADPRFARVRRPDPLPPSLVASLRGVVGLMLMQIGLRLIRSRWPG